MNLEYFKKLEVEHRQGIHPDQCPKLMIHSVEFAIPPRGLRVVPQFDADGKATLDVAGVEDWPELAELLPKAGEATEGRKLTLDLDDSAGLLRDLMGLARKALLKQYKLDDAQVAELLSFDTDESPQWVSQLLRWAHGLPMDFDPMDSLFRSTLPADEYGDFPEPSDFLAQEIVGEVEIVRPWWKFWSQ